MPKNMDFVGGGVSGKALSFERLTPITETPTLVSPRGNGSFHHNIISIHVASLQVGVTVVTTSPEVCLAHEKIPPLVSLSSGR